MNLISILLITISSLWFNPRPDKLLFEPVYVEWVDIASTDSGWHTVDEIDEWLVEEVNVVHQVGFLYRENEHFLVLIDSYFDENVLGTVTKIPKGCILKIVK